MQMEQVGFTEYFINSVDLFYIFTFLNLLQLLILEIFVFRMSCFISSSMSYPLKIPNNVIKGIGLPLLSL